MRFTRVVVAGPRFVTVRSNHVRNLVGSSQVVLAPPRGRFGTGAAPGVLGARHVGIVGLVLHSRVVVAGGCRGLVGLFGRTPTTRKSDERAESNAGYPI